MSKKIFNEVEVLDGYSLSSKHFSLSPLFQPLPKNRIKRDLYNKMLDNSINDYLVSKTYETKDYKLNISMIEMNNTTDELLLLTLLSFNRGLIEITLKDLAITLGFGKESTKEITKSRIMDSLNKLLKCSLNIDFLNGDKYGFHILKYNYTLNNEGIKTLKVYFDEDFVKLYTSTNLGFVDLKLHKSLQTDYEKSLYVMSTNFFSTTDAIKINKKVMIEKFGEDYLAKDKKYKINNSLKSLKSHGILKSYRINKGGDLVIIKEKLDKAISNKINQNKEENKMLKNNGTKKMELLDLPENTVEEAKEKINKLLEVYNDFHNGLSIKESVQLGKKAKQLQELFNVLEETEKKIDTAFIASNKELDEIFGEQEDNGEVNELLSYDRPSCNMTIIY